MKNKLPALLLVFVLCLARCKDGNTDGGLSKGIKFAEREFRLIRTDILVRASFHSIREQGGTLTSFLAASAPTGEGMSEDLPRFCNDDPCGPYSIALSQDQDSGEIVIEAYGNDLSEPLEVRRVKIDSVEPPA